VLAALDLAVPVGRVVALVGANGAGKSTLLTATAGVLDLRAGTATPTIGDAPPASIGWVPQRPALAQWLRLPAALALVGAPPAALDVLLEPDAERGARGALAHRRAGALSPGQVQALAVAAALHREDPLLLLDEPFAGVDLARRARLRAMIADRRRRRPGDVVVLSSHVATDLDELCDWVVALRDGRVTFAGDRARLGALRGAAFERRLASLT
jgi:ABC-2 type transport system ATP-binding protein